MKQQHHPIDLKTFQKGINSDSNKEFLGSNEEGEHVDALNMRSMSMDGDNSAKKKIKGEDLLYDAIDNRCFLPSPGTLSDDYQCMMSQEINENLVEIWASPIVGEDPFIRINGVIVLMSEFFPVSVATPLQYDKNEACVGGEFYITNNVTPPMVFSVKDLMMNSSFTDAYPEAACTQKYFDDFNLEEYTIQTKGTLYKPAFIKQVSGSSGSFDTVIGTSGLCVGSYSYSYRYVTLDGDRTTFSPITELIPVARNNSSLFAPHFPYSRTFSSAADITSSTNYGNYLKIRYENESDFSFIELRRDSWYSEDPLGNAPVSEIIASIPISNGMDILHILDRAEAGFEGATILDLGEQTDKNSTIQRAKAIRYFNERLYLMNVGYASNVVDNEFDFIDTVNEPIPVIQKIGKAGHKHAYNAAMFKSNMRGERTGFGVVLYDKNSNPSYGVAIPNATNFQFPNRRDEVSTETEGLSYFGVVKAALVDGTVGNSHEVFDHYDASKKSEYDGNDDWLISYEDNDPYTTLNPTSQNDTANDLQYLMNANVGFGNSPNIDYAPSMFGLDYYAQGIGFKGIENYDTNTHDGFSVVQTEPAKRVLAQGLGFYSILPAKAPWGVNASKDTEKFFAYFPDFETVAPDVYEDFKNNPSSYKIQCVSPLGYASELFSHLDEGLDTRDKGADILTYARVLRDNDASLASDVINPGLCTVTGITGGDGYGYVAYGKFTNHVANSDGPSFPSNGNGNYEFTVDSATLIATNSGIQEYLDIALTESIYNEAGTSGDFDANDDGVMDWREPLYVINLVRDSNINPGLTTEYKYGSTYVKFNSLVMEGTGGMLQTAPLTSERWEDCITYLSGQVYNAYSSLYRFVYVVDSNGVERRWLNVTDESAPFIAGLLTAMDASITGSTTVTDASGTYDVFGVYRHTQTTDDLCPVFTLTFNANPAYLQFTSPQVGDKVYVKYDNRIPVRVFGGDTYINESIWAVIDNEYGNNGEPKDSGNEYPFNIPFPYKSYDYANKYRCWKNSDIAGTHDYQNDNFTFRSSLSGNSAWIRQLIVNWTAETRGNLSFAYNNESPDKANSAQFYPLINYIPRPHKWNSGNEDNRATFESNNHLNPEYYNDYGFEWNLWQYGGIRFKPQFNLDYSKSQTTDIISSVPTVGFEEQTDYCTRIVWSQKRPVNVQNSDTVRTFPANNYFDISDDTGCIKFAWSALSSDKGNNLYAITDSGVCLLLVDKRIIHEINANELATVGSDIGGILDQLWLDKNIGMHKETWRTWAEYSNMLFFANGVSAYLFTDNQIKEIAQETGFFELLKRKFFGISEGSFSDRLSGGFNVKNKEYVMNVQGFGGRLGYSTLIFGLNQGALQCQSTYNYDKYLYIGNRFYGMKNTQTYELGIGNQIDGEDMEAYVTGVSDKEIYFDKEFLRVRVNSNSKPDKIYFYDSYEDYINDDYSSVVDATVNPIAIKNYFGYECYIPRKVVAPYYRQQGRVLLFKIVSTTDEDFLVTSAGVQYKALK
jgi:hypothetical protein